MCVSSVVFLYCWSLVESGANRRQSPAATTQTEVLRRRGGGAQSVRVPDGGWLATADVFCRMYCADRHKKHAAGDGVRDQTSPYVAGSRRSFTTPRSIPRAVDPLRGHIPHSRGTVYINWTPLLLPGSDGHTLTCDLGQAEAPSRPARCARTARGGA